MPSPQPSRFKYARDVAKPHPVTSGFYCQRVNESNIVNVLTSASYLVAEYNVRMRSFSWQRLLPANQKLTIEQWVREKFPEVAKPVTKAVAKPEMVKSKAASR